MQDNSNSQFQTGYNTNAPQGAFAHNASANPGSTSKPKRRVNMFLILSIVFGLTTVALVGLGYYLWTEYEYQKNNVDTIAAERVNEALKEQAEKFEAEFLEREKEPRTQFTGPDDLGRLTFLYPKTWSVLVESGLSPYRATLHPLFIDGNNSRYAARVLIEEKSYENVIAGYKDRVARRGLSSKTIEVGADDNKVLGTRFDGPLSDKVVGSAVVFKIRDKTVTIQTDIETLRSDFDNLVASIKFNK